MVAKCTTSSERFPSAKSCRRLVAEASELEIPLESGTMIEAAMISMTAAKTIEIPIDRNSEAFKLITRIQDEAHRFAIEFHRSLRSKKQVKSILDDIPGVGPARRKALMQHFKSIDNIKEASLENLEQAPSMTKNIAKSVYDFFH